MSSADRKGAIGVSANWLRTWPRRYGLAVFAVVAASAASDVPGLTRGFFPPFVTFFAAVILVALLAGLGPGIFATFLSAISIAILFWTWAALFGSSRLKEFAWLGIFCGFGCAVSALANLYRRHESTLLELERVFEGTEDMMVVVDRNYRYVIANDAFLKYRGIQKEDLVGRHVRDVLKPGVFESTVKEKLDESFQGKVVQYEMRYTYPTKGERDLRITYFPILGSGGVDRVASVLEDITGQKRIDRSLQLFRTLIDQSNDAVAVIDPETLCFLDVNERACIELGYTREEMLSLAMYDVDPLVNDPYRATFVEKLRKTGPIVQETTHRRKDRSTFFVEESVKYVELDRGYIVAVSRDISERRADQEAMKESEDRYRDLIEHSDDLVCTHDLEGNLLSVNAAPARLLGYEVGELLKQPMRELVAPEFREQFDAYLDRIRARGEDQGCLCVLTRSGQRRIWEYNNTLCTEGVASPIVRGMAHDVTERKHSEEALRYAKEFSENLIQTANVIILGLDMEGNVNLLNSAGEEITGYTFAELKGKSWSAVAPRDRFPEAWEEFDRLVEGTAGATYENPIFTKAGEERYIAWRNSTVKVNGKIVATISFGNDITKVKRAEEALRRREEDYRRFVAQSSEGIFRQDMDVPVAIDLPEDELIHHILNDSHMAECNDALARMYGFSSGQELVGKKPTEIRMADDPRNIELTRDYIRAKFRIMDRESHELDIHGNPKVFRNSMIGVVENGKLVRSWGIQRDVTEQVRGEEARCEAVKALRESEERFRVALKDSPITVFNQDHELRYTWIYNPQLYWQHEVIGKTDEEILGKKTSTALVELKRRVLQDGLAVREEVAIPLGGRNHIFDMTVEPVFDGDRQVIGMTGACMDIARLREMADRLQESTDRLAREKSYLETQIETELGFEEIIGQSPCLREVLRKARIVAPTDSSVLLLGETGTGKELVARSIHQLSARHERTFVKLNCASVPSGLLESELFGHEKGAFTGAVAQKVGRIELADKGTLFLDEIGELPLELQPKLLRVLQDREFERLGGVKTLKVDVRIISATNRDLQQDIADKQFREDLFYRLKVFPIELPALRERREDIPSLVHHFVGKHALKMGKRINEIPDEVLRILREWNWPGNIRELENMIERMVILTKGHVLEAPPAEIQNQDGIAEEDLTEMERDHIIRVLRETHGVLSGDDGAANRLGLKRTTLQSMMKRLGIDAHDYRGSISGTYGKA